MMLDRFRCLLIALSLALVKSSKVPTTLAVHPFFQYTNNARSRATRQRRHASTMNSPSSPLSATTPLFLRGGGPSTASTTTRTTSVPRQLLTGGTSRALAQILLYPIDALRTLAQTRDGRTLADVGTAALLRGCTTTSCFALGMGAIQFAVYGWLQRQYHVSAIWSSAAGAAASCLVSVPQEVIKQRLVTGVYGSFREAVVTIYRTEGGIRGFYSAWRPTMTRNVPFVMTTFTTMDILKRRRLRKKGGEVGELSWVENLLIGVTSAMVAGLVTQPVDVIKTRMMTQAASSAVPYRSALDCFTTIVRTEGVLTLYAGLRQRATYMCLLWGITFAVNGKLEGMGRRRESAGRGRK